VKSKKGGQRDEKKEMARKMAYIGAGAGLVLFAVMGLLPGSLLGGALASA